MIGMIRRQFGDVIKWVWMAVKYKIRCRVFKPYYREVVEVQEENFDGRKIDVIVLECGHKYWQEKLSGGLSVGRCLRLCDSCFRTACIRRFGEVRGGRLFGKWERVVKGR